MVERLGGEDGEWRYYPRAWRIELDGFDGREAEPRLVRSPADFASLPSQRVLRSPPFHHGVRSQGMRGCRLRQTARRSCQVDEVHRWFHDPLRTSASLPLPPRSQRAAHSSLLTQPARDFVDQAVRHVLLRQGVLGIKVKIMKGWDPEGRTGPSKPLPDVVTSTSSSSSPASLTDSPPAQSSSPRRTPLRPSSPLDSPSPSRPVERPRSPRPRLPSPLPPPLLLRKRLPLRPSLRDSGSAIHVWVVAFAFVFSWDAERDGSRGLDALAWKDLREATRLRREDAPAKT